MIDSLKIWPLTETIRAKADDMDDFLPLTIRDYNTIYKLKVQDNKFVGFFFFYVLNFFIWIQTRT